MRKSQLHGLLALWLTDESQRPRQCPLHELTAFPLGYKRAVPAYHMRRKGIGYNYAHIPLRPAIE